MRKIFSNLVTSTMFKYMVAITSAYLAEKLGIEAGNVEGFFAGGVAILMGVWGVWEAGRDKVVVGGARQVIPKNARFDAIELINMIRNKK